MFRKRLLSFYNIDLTYLLGIAGDSELCTVAVGYCSRNAGASLSLAWLRAVMKKVMPMLRPAIQGDAAQ